MGQAAKRRIKEYFKNKTESDESVEFLRMFILPFVSKYQGWGHSIDEIISSFFNAETRKIYSAKALRAFKMPGAMWRNSGGKPLYGIGVRQIERGQMMIVVEDLKDGSAKIELVGPGETKIFNLASFEFSAIKEALEKTDA